MKCLKLFLPAALLLGSVAPAYAWGRDGHRIVADIAADRLTPEAAAAVKAILGSDSLADIAPYADDYRSDHPETGPWHYVDIPLNSNEYDRDRDCPAPPASSNNAPGQGDWRDCAPDRISYFFLRLRNPSLSADDRRLALEMLVHLVGDLHQPLHAIGDARGGNSIRVGFLGTTQCGERQLCNLHGIWDYSIIDRRDLNEKKYVKQLEAEISEHHWDTLAQGNPQQWANESHAYAVQAWVPNNVMLGRDYYDAQVKVVDKQLSLAGIRLARLLNAAFRGTTPATAPASTPAAPPQ